LRSDLKLRSKKFTLDQERLKVRVLLGRRVVKTKDYDGLKLICDDESWLMFRASGTEPKMRVYAEAKSLKRAKELVRVGHALVEREIRYRS